MIAPGDVTPRRDSRSGLYVAVLSNAIHLAANTGRVITCPFIPGRIAADIWQWWSSSMSPRAHFC